MNGTAACETLLATSDARAWLLLEPLFEACNRGVYVPDLRVLLDAARTALSPMGAQSARLSFWLSQVVRMDGALDEALAEVEAGLTEVEASQVVRTELLIAKSSIHRNQAAMDLTQEAARAALAGARGNSAMLAKAYNNWGSTQHILGRYGESAEAFRAGLAETGTDGRLGPILHCNLGALLSQIGDYEAATQSLERARAMALARHDHRTAHSASSIQAMTLGRAGRLVEADAHYQRVLANEDQFGGKLTVGSTRLNAGIAAALVGDLARARVSLTQAHRVLARHASTSVGRVVCEAYLLICHAGLGNLVEAKFMADQLSSRSELAPRAQGEVTLSLGHLDVANGRAAAEAGDASGAQECWSAAQARLLQLGADIGRDLELGRDLLERTLSTARSG